MPELPEVETVVRGLRASLPGRTILDVRLGKTDFIDDPVSLGERLPGARILDVTRLGKFVSIGLILGGPAPNLDERFYLVIHLGMTGQLTTRLSGDPVPPHTHVFFALDDGRELRYTDIRRFGRMLLVPESRIAGFRDRLGAEPLEITLEEFCARFCAHRSKPYATPAYCAAQIGPRNSHDCNPIARLLDFGLCGFRREPGRIPVPSSGLSTGGEALLSLS
jgi:formamidopyrimidine-DNA glycosylase